MINYLKINAEETVGNPLLMLGYHIYPKYIDGIRGEDEGLIISCLSEVMGYEKIDVKIAGIFELPFIFDGTPIPVEFEELKVKAWQNWKCKNEIKLSITAKGIRPFTRKQIKLEGGHKE